MPSAFNRVLQEGHYNFYCPRIVLRNIMYSKVMLAKNAPRRLIGSCRRTFSNTTPLKSSTGGKVTDSAKPGHASRWTGRRVLVLSSSAAATGFGLAMVLQGPPKDDSSSLCDNTTSEPKYATKKELEHVSHSTYTIQKALY